MDEIIKREDALFGHISKLIDEAHKHVKTTVNTTMVYTYYGVGKYIVEDEQQGYERATYGKKVLKVLSEKLYLKYGDGWSYSNLRQIRQFYLAYANLTDGVCQIQFDLSWSHYLILMRIEKPSDIIKNPITLEFLGLKPDSVYSESKLENAIINKMQQFLLELGKGFLFEARQKRFTFEEQHFFVDLVFYNRLLQCYVLIDLKIDKLTHQDLGQMQMYVNYYDRYVKLDFEKPTIGILLCKEKNDALVELTLPKDANIYASAYQLYLPNKDLLQAKVKEWIEEFEENEEIKKLEEDK